jgi:hypothetical protein
MNKREMFARLRQHLSKLADEVEQAMKSSIARTLGWGLVGTLPGFNKVLEQTGCCSSIRKELVKVQPS